MAKAPKRLFINKFVVSYEVLYADWEATRAGVNTGATSANLSVGFEGVDDADFQEITDKLYADYVKMMQAAGFEVITAKDLQGNKAFAKAELVSGSPVDYQSEKGEATTTPTGFPFFLLGGKYVLAPRIKAEAVVADVHIKVPFMIDSEAGASKLATKAVGGVSKVVASPALRISAQSQHDFTWETNSVVKVPMKGDLMINGVFQDEKFKASVAAQTNTQYDIGHLTRVYSEDVNVSNIQVAKGDPEKYKKGVYDGASLFLKESSNVFLGWMK